MTTSRHLTNRQMGARLPMLSAMYPVDTMVKKLTASMAVESELMCGIVNQPDYLRHTVKNYMTRLPLWITRVRAHDC